MTHKIRWTAQKISQRLGLIQSRVYTNRAEIPPFRHVKLSGPMEPPPIATDVDDSGWDVIAPNSYWGEWLTDYALRTTFTVPAEWDSNVPIALFLPLGNAGDFLHPESLIYIDGVAYAACDREHQEVRLPDWVRDGQPHQLTLHTWTGGIWSGGHNTQLFMQPCHVVQIHQPTRDFAVTARVALGVANKLDENTTARNHLLNALDDAFKVLDTRDPIGEDFYASVPEAHAVLREGIARAGSPLEVEVVATGHAHIDVAWLWTLGQTRRKAGRSFHTVLRLMEQFPEYHFTQSQPQLYEYVRQDYPELFEAIKQRVAEGRWEATGDMWVEADCNLSGAESLARQFLLGRHFFREHFGRGVSSPVLWLPDVFGYAWALPQLIKLADLDYFFTIKIGWSQYNRLPYDSFWWQGVDGTRVLTHFSPTPEPGSAYASTYNATATAADVIGTWTNYRQKDLNGTEKIPPLLMAFGFGDGGGGPTREMLENLREMTSFPGAPRVRQGHVGDFFRELETKAGEQLPTWNGELYLEYHRGTYTSQSRNKRANRKSEFLLHDAEFVATLASLIDPSYQYPSDTFRTAWRLICLNQFHDIIPGSSINQVYVESQEQYREIRALGEQARDSALDVLARSAGGDVIVVNPTGFARSDLALFPGSFDEHTRVSFNNGEPFATQPVEGGLLVDLGTVEPLSVIALTTGQQPQASAELPASALVVSENLLENQYLRVELNADGDITRIYDKANEREVVPEGALANQFQLFEDRPMNWEAWDIDIFYDDKMWLADPAESVRVIEQGPLRATIEIKRRAMHSTYIQRISLSHNSPRLDFDTEIDWREKHTLLKVAFPVDILSPVATYEIQWGNVQRPTHRNTSWDWARFETCAQKWADLSEGGYGVSLINDCKYGHDIQNNVMRISLLRSPTHPDPKADQGQHRFSYSLLPHAGDWAATIPHAYALNDPLIVYSRADGQPAAGDQQAVSATGVARQSPFVAADKPNVVIETIKRAEDGNGVIVRLYESQRRRGPVTLHTSFPLASAHRVNLLEDDKEQLTVSGSSVALSLRPYEIVTLRLIPA